MLALSVDIGHREAAQLFKVFVILFVVSSPPCGQMNVLLKEVETNSVAWAKIMKIITTKFSLKMLIKCEYIWVKSLGQVQVIIFWELKVFGKEISFSSGDSSVQSGLSASSAITCYSRSDPWTRNFRGASQVLDKLPDSVCIVFPRWFIAVKFEKCCYGEHMGVQ
jgi:predicted nucleic-acid-binding Zn-ribbon protein